MTLLETILRQMSSLTAPQRKFMQILLSTLMCLRGKANYRNLSRYSGLHEKTHSRWSRRVFDFVQFNRLSLSAIARSGQQLAAALDCSFIAKSGRHSYGLGWFYHSQHGQAEQGLEIATLALVDVDYNTAYALSTRQTPATVAASDASSESRVDAYLAHLRQDRHALPDGVKYLLTDGYYSKTKFLAGVRELGLHQVGKLRHDARLRYLYTGPQKRRGRPKQYDGKVTFSDLSRLERIDDVDGLRLYTGVVNSVAFKRDLRIVYLVKQEGKQVRTALLFATDTALAAAQVYRLYKARFQIEFLFRDAKQFTGLCDGQARNQAALHFQFNAAMSALNLLKLEDRQQAPDAHRDVISIASWKIRKFNEHLLARFSDMLGLDLTWIKAHPAYETLRNYGAIAE